MAAAPLTLLLRQTFGKQFLRKKFRPALDKLKITSPTIQDFSCPCYFYCTQVLFRNDVTVQFRDGLPVISVPLPSRRESCEFTLKPITHTVGDFLKFIQEEDGGIDRSAVYTPDGSRVAKSTTIDILLRNNFSLSINDQSYSVSPPQTKAMVSEDLENLSDVKNLVTQLYSTLNLEHYQLERESELRAKLEDLQQQIAPYEKKKNELAHQANRYTHILTWTGLGLMAVQFGVLARLTWWEYSWDIMEPVTYFVTYGTTIAMYAYFVLSKQEYNFVDVKDRQFLLKFYKAAKKEHLDVDKYNQLKNAIALTELDLQRLRDPLQLHLPIREQKKIKL
ncbi:hypothetical protein SNE40_005838 [Patella caerulea]|uniref:Calcium uniporter protein n=1 Tax=Patella caerulea TaxID=87958 RepID=A0AAN8PXW0_PATCE